MESLRAPRRIWALNLPLMSLTRRQTVQRIDALIQQRRPGYVITANLNYAMLVSQHPELRSISQNAQVLVADGMPLLWAAALTGRRLPERVCGSDLVYDLAALAAERGYRLFLVGGEPGVAEAAAKALKRFAPTLQIVGIAVPPFGDWSSAETDTLVQRIRASRADLLFAALGQPKGEQFLAAQVARMGAPVAIQVGAAFDMVAGRVPRAPTWMRASGLEWLFRLAQEPRRLGTRYLRNGCFLVEAFVQFVFGSGPRHRPYDRASSDSE